MFTDHSPEPRVYALMPISEVQSYVNAIITAVHTLEWVAPLICEMTGYKDVDEINVIDMGDGFRIQMYDPNGNMMTFMSHWPAPAAPRNTVVVH